MKKLLLAVALFALLLGCASPVRFIQTNESYVIKPKPEGAKILFKKTDKIKRPHRVIGVIEVVLGKRARRPELDALMKQKAREIGADGIMLVDYDVDRTTYVEKHHAVVGRGPWRRHVVVSNPRTSVRKSATGIAVVFK